MTHTDHSTGDLDVTMTVNEWAARWPSTRSVLVAHGFDTHSDGALPLHEAARRRDVSLHPLLDELHKAVRKGPSPLE